MSSDIFFYLTPKINSLNSQMFIDASKALAALFNTALEFFGLQAVPNVLGGK